MIIRIWNGSTTLENADKYEQLLRGLVFPGIQQKNVPGYLGIQLLRRAVQDETSFVTMMAFESWDAVTQFAGDDYEKAYIIDEAKSLLKRHDDIAVHYELVENTIGWQQFS